MKVIEQALFFNENRPAVINRKCEVLTDWRLSDGLRIYLLKVSQVRILLGEVDSNKLPPATLPLLT